MYVVSRVALTGAGPADTIEDETLSKAMDCWARFNKEVDYTSDPEVIPQGYLNSKQFKLKLKPGTKF